MTRGLMDGLYQEKLELPSTPPVLLLVPVAVFSTRLWSEQRAGFLQVRSFWR